MKYLPILRVVFDGMACEHFPPQFGIFKKGNLWQLVHKFAVDLMFYKGHQNDHRRKPSDQ